MPCLSFLIVKYSHILLSSIEMQTTNWLPIIIVQQNTEITLRIPISYTGRLYNRSD